MVFLGKYVLLIFERCTGTPCQRQSIEKSEFCFGFVLGALGTTFYYLLMEYIPLLELAGSLWSGNRLLSAPLWNFSQRRGWTVDEKKTYLISA